MSKNDQLRHFSVFVARYDFAQNLEHSHVMTYWFQKEIDNKRTKGPDILKN